MVGVYGLRSNIMEYGVCGLFMGYGGLRWSVIDYNGVWCPWYDVHPMVYVGSDL